MEPFIPDLLRRFVEMPHKAVVSMPNAHIRIESNDPELPEHIATYVSENRIDMNAGRIRLIRLVREDQLEMECTAWHRINTPNVTVVLRGQGTILLFDHTTFEVLGFITSDVSTNEVMGRLFAALIDPPTLSISELQTGDIRTIGL